MEGADSHEAGILPRGPRVGLKGHGVKASDGAQLRGQVSEHLVVSYGLKGVGSETESTQGMKGVGSETESTQGMKDNILFN